MILQIICGVSSVQATGIPVLSMDHFTMYVASFMEKMEKIKIYDGEIETTERIIDSLGSLNTNAAVDMLWNEGAEGGDGTVSICNGGCSKKGQNTKGVDKKAYAAENCPATRDDECNGKDVNGCMYAHGKLLGWCPLDVNGGRCDAYGIFKSGKGISACADLGTETYRHNCEVQYDLLERSAARVAKDKEASELKKAQREASKSDAVRQSLADKTSEGGS